ncbi:MAG TPA: hypothetical protein VLM76_09060 [Patescibacteria group bacterium]|nr:hypothetical protein [Patescibacteria group bacterium]
MNGRRTVYDDLVSKTVIYDGRCLVSYAGVACAQGDRTDMWLVEAINDAPRLDDALARVSTEAERRLRTFDPTKAHLTFVGAAWIVPRFRSRPVAHLIELSNVSPAGYTEPAQRRFRQSITRLEEPAAVRCTGQPLARTPILAAQRLADLKREIRGLALAHASPREIALRLIGACHQSALDNPLIGPHMLISSIPRDAPLLEYAINFGRPNWHGPEFRFLAGDDSHWPVIAPGYVGGGLMVYGTRVTEASAGLPDEVPCPASP